MELVINEWILEYIKPDTEKQEIEIFYRFFDCLQRRNYKIALLKNSRFINKLYRYAKDFGHISRMRKIIKYFLVNMYDPYHFHVIIKKEINNNIESRLMAVPEDDRYLILTALNCGSEKPVIISTDNKLIEIAKNNFNIEALSPSEFLDSYCYSNFHK